MKKKIAIIGSGISGLTCGYMLSDYYDIELFEANDYIGGHTHTVDVEGVAIDTGFIVFNNKTYPNFKRILDTLQVKYQKTEMSFSVRNDKWNLEYNANNLNSLFAQRSNLLNPKFYRLIYDILRFNKLAKMCDSLNSNLTLGEFLKQYKFNNWFIEGYVLPIGSAIWSMGILEMLEFPFAFFSKFFNNHGLLNITNRPQWYTISGGSRNYIPKLIAKFEDKIYLNTKVDKIIRNDNNSVHVIFANGDRKSYDEVICACHSNQALNMIVSPSVSESQILGAIKYSSNDVILRKDKSLLPKHQLANASWNYFITSNSNNMATLTYNMNILQRLDNVTTYCVTLNSNDIIDPNKILAHFKYEHPVYTKSAHIAQSRWDEISGKNRIHFCGAYWANGFHEDGVKSALMVCNKLGVSFAG